jgi:hypothetical protein
MTWCKGGVVAAMLAMGLVAGCATDGQQPTVTRQIDGKEAKIAQLMELTHSARAGQQMANTVISQMTESFGNSCAKCTPEAMAILRSDLQDEMSKILPEIQSVTAQVYAEHFTDADIDNMISFYQSPTGQKLTDAMPQVMREIAERTHGMARDAGQRAAARALASLKSMGYIQ